MISTPLSRLSFIAARATVCGVAVLCAGLLSASCKGSSAPPQTATPAAQPAAPPAPPINPNGPRIYVSDETGRDVVVIDPDTGQVVGRIEVGKRPRGLRLSKDGKQLFIALSGSPIGGPGVDESKLPPADRAADGIGVVDVASGKLVRKFTSGPDPESFDISPDGKFLYVSNEDAAEMSASGSRVGRDHASRQGRRRARGRHGSPRRPRGLCDVRGRQRRRRHRHEDLQGGRKDRYRPPSAVDGVHAGQQAGLRGDRENGNAVNVVDAQKHKVLADAQAPADRREPRRRRGRWAPRMSPDARRSVRVVRPREVGRRHRRRDSQARRAPSRTSGPGRGASASARTAGILTRPTVLQATSRSSTSRRAGRETGEGRRQPLGNRGRSARHRGWGDETDAPSPPSGR